jgi:hypothetical protein
VSSSSRSGGADSPLYLVESGAIAAVDESGDEPVTVAIVPSDQRTK